MQALALGQPVALLAHQLGPGLDDAQRHALGVGAEARHGLPERQRGITIEPQPLGHHGGPERQHGCPVDPDLAASTRPWP